MILRQNSAAELVVNIQLSWQLHEQQLRVKNQAVSFVLFCLFYSFL